MTKIRLIIYASLLIFITLTLIICIFSLSKKTNSPKTETNLISPTIIPITEISWSEAVNLVQNCQIKSIFQKNNREVTLTDKENRVFKTKEVKFNDIFEEINHLPANCNDVIQSITE